MATVRGTAINPNYSQRWIYADFYNLIWDSGNNAFRYNIDLYSEYQHQRSAYTGAYGEDNVSVTYTVSNANVNGTSRSVTSVSYSPYITYGQYTGQQWKATTYVWLPTDVTSKTCTISAPNPNWAYSFWNYAVSGTITTPTVSWAAPSASMSVINNTPGIVKLNGSYTINGTLATLSSAVIYCDTNSNPTTVRSNNVEFSVNHNTTYYWKYVVTDNHGKSTTITGNFITVGNAPTMTGTSVSNITTNGAVIDYTVSYDTNASYSSRNIEYGTTTSYGSSTTNTTLSGLLPNTTYYYRVRVTDNFGRTSEWITGSFITHPTTVQVVNPQVTNITFSGCTLSMGSSDNSVTDMSSYAIYASDQTTLIQGHFDDTPAVYSKNITGLEPNTTYYARFALRTERSNAWSTIQWVQFTTPVSADYAKVIYEDGTIVTKKMYAISGKNLLDERKLINNANINITTGIQEAGTGTIPIEYIKVEPSTIYTITRPVNSGNIGVRCYDINKNYIGSSPEITNMSWMFADCSATSLDLSSFDTSNVTDMSYMFYNCSATTLDLSSFDTSNVTNMSNMFQNCLATTGYARTQADANRFNSSSGKPAGLTFVVKPDFYIEYETTAGTQYQEFATGADLKQFIMFNKTTFINHCKVVAKLPEITDCYEMFYDCTATSLDLSEFNTSSVIDMRRMFYNCLATSLDLSSFDTSSVTNMGGMFQICTATSLDLSSFDTSNVTNMMEMFGGCSATSIDLSSFDTSNVTNMSMMFAGCSVTSLDLSSFDTSNVTNMNFMFAGCSATTGYARTQADADRFNSSSGKSAGLATTGYARTQADADRFNSSSGKSAGLTFVVKPDFYIEYETTAGTQYQEFATGADLKQFIMDNKTTFINHCKVVAKLPEITGSVLSKEFTTPSNCHYFKFVDEGNTLNKGYQLEKGSATQYEPFIKEITRDKLHLIE